jgi:uncharacterized integral membrane protein (TIGR00698 family)
MRVLSTKQVALAVGGLACLLPVLPTPTNLLAALPAVAMIAGALIGIGWNSPQPASSRRLSRFLMQGSVVLLGFSINLAEIAQAGSRGLVFSLVSISSVFAVGWLLQRAMKIRSMTGLLISAGTAICGGSAIAAVSTVVESPAEDVAVAAGAVFVLNGIALLVFPPIGHALGLSQYAFGVWSGIAIHDIASVVGAGAAYGSVALKVATAVKLSRVLFLAPILVAAMALRRRGVSAGQRTAASPMPWFVGLFLLASAARSFSPTLAAHSTDVKQWASVGFCLSLFLTGTALTRTSLKSVGIKPLLMGFVLWIFIASGSLLAVKLS